MTEVPISEYRELRGWILRSLYNSLPAWIGVPSLTTTLYKCGFDTTPIHVSGHLRYLAEKGYIEYKEVGESGLSRHVAKLTFKGVDLVEGNLDEDPGIIVK